MLTIQGCEVTEDMASLLTVGTLYVGGETRRSDNDVVEGERRGSKFWMKMRFLVGCMGFRSQPRGSSNRNGRRGGILPCSTVLARVVFFFSCE